MADDLSVLVRRAWRRYASDGVPSSGLNNPDKTGDIFAFGDALQVALDQLALLASVGFKLAEPVRVAATGNVAIATALENGDVVDGVTLATGDRVLLPAQTTAAQNGIYVVAASGAAARASDADIAGEFVGLATFVSFGTANGGKLYLCTTPLPIVLGTTALTFRMLLNSANLNSGLAAVVAEVTAARNGAASLDARLDGELAARLDLEADLLQETVERLAADASLDTRLDVVEPLLTALQTTYGAGISRLIMEDLSKKFARAGMDAMTYDENYRLITAMRKRDGVYVIGANGIETNDFRIVNDPKFRRSGLIGAKVDMHGRLIEAHRTRDRMHVFGADGIATRYQASAGLPVARFSRSAFLSGEMDQTGRLIKGLRRDGAVYVDGKRVVLGNAFGAPIDDYIVYTQSVASEVHVFSERRSNGKRLRLSTLGASHSDPSVTRDGNVVWTSGGELLWSPIDVADQHRVLPRKEFIGVGDSLTEQNYGADLATLSGVPYRNIGKSAQTSLGCATRFGARQMRLVSVTGQIPASGSVQVACIDGLGVMDFYGPDTVSGIGGTVLGIPVTIGHNDATKVMTLTRVSSGSAVPLPPGTPFVFTQIDSVSSAAISNSDEMMGLFFFGRNNWEAPDQIFADFKACVARLRTLSKRFLVIPYMPTKDEVTGNLQAYRNWSYLMGLCLAEWPDNTSNMRAAMIAYAGSEAAYWATLMSVDQTHPTAAGRLAMGTIINNLFLANGWY